MSKTYVDWQVWQDREIAHQFTDVRRAAVPSAEAQFDTMARLVREVTASPLTVLDVGCGDGILMEAVLRAFPVERAIALDGSAAMLERAQARLGSFGNFVEFVEADFNDPAWTERLPVRSFDAVVSSFAIHHSEDAQKRAIYAAIFELLKPGGVFVNIEHIGSETSLGEQLFERLCAENLTRIRQAQGEEVTFEQVYHEITTRADKAANRLAPVETQLQWLREIGFTDVDCYWKQFELAVLAGYKESPRVC